jgi:hypothetical protein
MSKTTVSKQFKDIISEYKKEFQANIEEALDVSSLYMQNQLESQSPRATGGFADSWDRKMEYKNVRYIGNKKVTPRPKQFSSHKGGIPLSSLLEYGIKGRPFINRTFKSNMNKCHQIFVKKMEG